MGSPAKGSPVSVAKLITMKTKPTLTPVFVGSVVRILNIARNNYWIPAAKKAIHKRSLPPTLEMAVQQYKARLP